MFLVIRNVNKWDVEGSTQSYSMAVAIWRDKEHDEVHAELEAELEAIVEIPIEIELEA